MAKEYDSKYLKAPLVESGDSITSTQMNQLAEAWNSRIAQGMADCWWQIAFAAESFVSQIRQHADQSTSASRHEWLKEYSYLKANARGESLFQLWFSYDNASAPGAVFPGSPLGAWVGGGPFRGGSNLNSWVAPEYDRLFTGGRRYYDSKGNINNIEEDHLEKLANEGYQTTAKNELSVWEEMPANAFSKIESGYGGEDAGIAWHNIAKKQRGLATGLFEFQTSSGINVPYEVQKSPFSIAATIHHMIVPNHGTKIGVTYGGWTPSPRISGQMFDWVESRDEKGFTIPVRRNVPVFSMKLKNKTGGEDVDIVVSTARVFNEYDSESDRRERRRLFRDRGVTHIDFRKFGAGWYAWKYDPIEPELEYFPESDYTLVLDGEAELKHHPDPYLGQGKMFMWDVILAKYASEFKGSTEQQKEKNWDIRKTGVDWQNILTRQSLLAPARARLVAGLVEREDTDIDVEDLVEVRTFFKTSFTTSASDKDFEIDDQLSSEWGDAKGHEIERTATSHRIAKGFTLAGILVDASKVSNLTIEIRSSSNPHNVVLKFKGNKNGRIERLHYFERDIGGNVSIKLVNGLPIEDKEEDENAEILIELIELKKSRMTPEEMYVLTRVWDWGRKDGDVQLKGDTLYEAKSISDDYFKYGCISAGNAGEDNIPNLRGNAIYETARQLINGYYKMFHREFFIGYDIIKEDGAQKSVFYFRRRSITAGFATGGDNDPRGEHDAFDKMGPSIVPLIAGVRKEDLDKDEKQEEGQIQSGCTYIVHIENPDARGKENSPAIEYNGKIYNHDDIFTGAAGETNFYNKIQSGQSSSPALAYVYEYEGIKQVATRNGLSNEWVMGLSFCPYDGGYSDDIGAKGDRSLDGLSGRSAGLFKPLGYADILGSLLSPAHLFSQELWWTGTSLGGDVVYRTVTGPNRTGERGRNLFDLRGQASIAWRSPNGANRPQFYSRRVIPLHEARTPSRLNFAKKTNGAFINDENAASVREHPDPVGHYKSMRMFRDPYRIESITPRDPAGNFSKVIVRVKLNRRLDALDEKNNLSVGTSSEIKWHQPDSKDQAGRPVPPNGPAFRGTDWSAANTTLGGLATSGVALANNLEDRLRKERYATDDNRILKYAMAYRYRYNKPYHIHFPPVTGDFNSATWIVSEFGDNLPYITINNKITGWSLPDHGNYLPFFHCVKLIEKVFEDDNDTAEQHDTLTWQHPFLHMAFCAPMCEGFVDKQETEKFYKENLPNLVPQSIPAPEYLLSNYELDNGISYDVWGEDPLDNYSESVGVFEYSIERCCLQAFDATFFEIPVPNTDMYASTFNQFASFVNQLTNMKLDMQATLEVRTAFSNGHIRPTTEPKSISVPVPDIDRDGTLNITGPAHSMSNTLEYEWIADSNSFSYDNTNPYDYYGTYWNSRGVISRVRLTPEERWFQEEPNQFWEVRGERKGILSNGSHAYDANLRGLHAFGSVREDEFRLAVDQLSLLAIPEAFRDQSILELFMREEINNNSILGSLHQPVKGVKREFNFGFFSGQKVVAPPLETTRYRIGGTRNNNPSIMAPDTSVSLNQLIGEDGEVTTFYGGGAQRILRLVQSFRNGQIEGDATIRVPEVDQNEEGV